MSRKKLSPKDRLPLMVMYEQTESWYYEVDQKPIAIYLEPEKTALYIRSLPSMRYYDAKEACMKMTDQNFFYRLPRIEELRLLMELKPDFDRVANLIGAERIKPSKYWSSTKDIEKNYFMAMSFFPKMELSLHVKQYAYVLPVIVM